MMAHGKSLWLRNIQGPRIKHLHRHKTAQTNTVRRHFKTETGGARTWPKGLRSPGTNEPYTNPDRDLKPARQRKLRKNRAEAVKPKGGR